jgi:aconitate hydratase
MTSCSRISPASATPPHRGDPLRGRPHRAAGLHRRAAARRPRRHALAVAKLGKNPKIIEPLVPVDLVVDHSVQVDFAGARRRAGAEPRSGISRNRERYQFLKWGMQAFDTFKVVPPGIGIVHQVNLEYLAKGVSHARGVYYPDTLVGTDSHTTMINGLGIVGWGVGGIEAEAGMLGQPVYFLTPDVVGVHLTGALREGVTATDLALTVTQLLRKAKVVGKFVEFFGPGAARCRSWTARPSPTWRPNTARRWASSRSTPSAQLPPRHRPRRETLSPPTRPTTRRRACGASPAAGPSTTRRSSNSISRPSSRASPARSARRTASSCRRCRETFAAFAKPGHRKWRFGKARAEGRGIRDRQPNQVNGAKDTIGHGSVLIAAITSCTNTSNPSVMLAAGLLAKKAVEKGLKVNPP